MIYHLNIVTASVAYQLYFTYIFQVFRVVYDFTFGLLPIPALYIFLISIIFLLARSLYVYRRQYSKQLKGHFIKSSVLRMFGFAGGIIVGFYVLWGFNYKREGVFRELGVAVIVPDSAFLVNETSEIVTTLNNLRALISKDTVAFSSPYSFLKIEAEIRKNQEQLLESWDVPIWGRVRVRKIHPQGILLGWSAAGIYIPFVMEGHIDGGLHPLQWPFVAAHEMAHGYGYTDEGDCNFVGFLTCISSEDNFVKYSGWLTYFRYLYRDLRRLDKDIAIHLYQNLNISVRNDLIAIQQQSDKFPDFFPWWRDIVYDNYLKSHGVADGLNSYNKIVRQVYSWRLAEKVPLLPSER